MNNSLDISNQIADAERRKIEWINLGVRYGRMPDVTVHTHWVHPDGGPTTITIGQVKLDEFIVEYGLDRSKNLVVRVANIEVEERIFKLFPDEEIAKKLFDHVFDSWKQILETEDGKSNPYFHRYGNTQLSAGSADGPYPEL
jgi:hypothetical protein